MSRIWHFIWRRAHRWTHSSFGVVYGDLGTPIAAEWFDCYCGARRWATTRASIQRMLAPKRMRTTRPGVRRR